MHSLKRLRPMTFTKLASALAIVGVLVACGKEPTSAGGGGGGGGKGGSTTEVHTDPFRFGDAVDGNGTVMRETSVIPPSARPAVSFNVRNVPAGTQVRVLWKDVAKNADAGEEVKPIADKGFVAFQRPQPLPEGSYRVDMFYKLPEAKDWRYLGTHLFTVGRQT
jgi:hypothetical protein